jgi:hypothetical protein
MKVTYMHREYEIDKEEARAIRRQAINNHMWMLHNDYPWQFETDNLRLCVRLYERELYGTELKVY